MSKNSGRQGPWATVVAVLTGGVPGPCRGAPPRSVEIDEGEASSRDFGTNWAVLVELRLRTSEVGVALGEHGATRPQRARSSSCPATATAKPAVFCAAFWRPSSPNGVVAHSDGLLTRAGLRKGCCPRMRLCQPVPAPACASLRLRLRLRLRSDRCGMRILVRGRVRACAAAAPQVEEHAEVAEVRLIECCRRAASPWRRGRWSFSSPRCIYFVYHKRSQVIERFAVVAAQQRNGCDHEA